jgi:tRNA(Ile)-lysidine synthase
MEDLFKVQNQLPQRFLSFVKENHLIAAGDRLLIGLSGGPDSVALLDLLDNLKKELKIEIAIAHYNHHQRSGESLADEQFVRELAEKRGVRAFFGQYRNRGEKLSENQARIERYRFLGESLGEWPGDKVVIAHQANDLSETLIFNLIRGAGIFGLSSIPLRREKICRPLLKFSRQELLDYLLARKLKYRHDRSNDDLKFSRNRIRKNVIPELKIINDKAVENLSQSAFLFAEQSAMIVELIEEKFNQVKMSVDKWIIKFDQKKFVALSPVLRRELLIFAIDKLKMKRDLSQKHFLAIDKLFQKNIGNKKICPKKDLQISLNGGIIKIEKIKTGDEDE